MIAVERRVQIAHHVTHLFAFAADDDAVRAPAIGHGRAFFQKFGIGDDIELQQTADLDQALVDVRTQGVAGAHRYCGFFHQDHRLFTMPRHRFTHRQHVTQIRRAILTGWRADRDEQHLAVLHGELFVGGELQPFGIQAFAHQAGQPRFENAHVALLQ
ncbi:hypothetical protein D3C86_1316980 [compost metagenome]